MCSRLTLRARHTRSHSAWTFSKPRKLRPDGGTGGEGKGVYQRQWQWGKHRQIRPPALFGSLA